MSDVIYLDHAAATPVNPDVLQAMLPYYTEQFYNPSATYLPAKAVAQDIAAARASVAQVIGARPSEVVFTAGGTEANNLAIHGVMRRHPDANLVVSAIEHDSVLRPVAGYDCRQAPVDQQGRVDMAKLVALIDDNTVLVSVIYGSNEIGTVEPIHDIGQLVAEIRLARLKAGSKVPLYLHTDACQAANYLDLHVARLGVDLMTLNGGKIYGPKQSGVLYVRGGIQLEPLVSGGGQEFGLRSGTENVAASIGFAHALKLVQAMRKPEDIRLKALQHHFIKALKTQVPQAILQGSLKHRLPNNVHVTIPGTDNERILLELEQAGILAAAGSACSASSEEPSHVLKACGLSDDEARSSLRFSMGQHTTVEQIDQVVAILQRLVTA